MSDDITHTSADHSAVEIQQEMIKEDYPEPPPATRLDIPTALTSDAALTNSDKEDTHIDNIARITTLENKLAKDGDKKDAPKTKITLSDYQVNRLNNPHAIRVKFNREGIELAVENITGSWHSNLQECIKESVCVYKFIHKHYEKYYNVNLHAEDLNTEDNPPPAPYEPKPSTSTYTHPGYGVIDPDNMSAQVESHGATSYLPSRIIEECRRNILEHQRQDSTPLRDENLWTVIPTRIPNPDGRDVLWLRADWRVMHYLLSKALSIHLKNISASIQSARKVMVPPPRPPGTYHLIQCLFLQTI